MLKTKGGRTMKERVYCEICDCRVKYSIRSEHIKESVNKVDIEYDGKKAYCNECGNEVYVGELDDKNTEIVNKIYRKKLGLISVEDIKLILEKYNIGASVLSKILNWGEVTVPRYIAGQTPSKEYSDKLKEILNNPREMYKLLQENKDKITPVAYKKCKESIENILNDWCVDIDNEPNIESISDYIVSKIDVTPKAIQKLLYFIQGFSTVFNDKPLFNDSPQAWVHGPVYSNIYAKYKAYKYNIIDSDENIELNLSQSNMNLINSVLKFFGCYSGDILEKITHEETPWQQAREGMKANQPSSKEIDIEDMKKYFTKVCDKYNIINVVDIKDYAMDMFYKVM